MWKLFKFAGCLILIGFMLVTGFLAYMTMHYTRQTLHPVRTVEQRIAGDLDTEFHYQKVEFVTSDGVLLRGWYFPSQNGAAVILGSGYSAHTPQMLPEAQLLAENGYGVLLFFWRGSGASEGDKVTPGDKEQLDLHAAIDFVAAQPDVDRERIGAVGFSMGAVVVTLVAAENPLLKAVVIEAPYSSLEAMVRHQVKFLGFFTRPIVLWTLKSDGIHVEQVNPAGVICKISPRPVFLIFGSADDVLPPDTMQIMSEAACEPKEIWLLDGAGHGNYFENADYPARLLNFFNRHLLNRPA